MSLNDNLRHASRKEVSREPTKANGALQDMRVGSKFERHASNTRLGLMSTDICTKTHGPVPGARGWRRGRGGAAAAACCARLTGAPTGAPVGGGAAAGRPVHVRLGELERELVRVAAEAGMTPAAYYGRWPGRTCCAAAVGPDGGGGLNAIAGSSGASGSTSIDRASAERSAKRVNTRAGREGGEGSGRARASRAREARGDQRRQCSAVDGVRRRLRSGCGRRAAISRKTYPAQRANRNAEARTCSLGWRAGAGGPGAVF